MPRRKRTGNRTFPKRSTLWLPFDSSLTLVSAGSVVQSGDLLGGYFGQTGEEVPIGATIGPIRGTPGLRPDVATSFDVAYSIEGVLQLVPEGGRAQLPLPGVDIIDSMWYASLLWDGNMSEVSAGVFQGGWAVGTLETKAMRKVSGNGQELKYTFVGNGNVDYHVRVFGNLMLKLP